MGSRLTASLREAPATVPAFAAIALFVVWATDQAGYPVTHWAPGGLIVLALLAISVAIVGLRPVAISAPVKVALAALAAYTALSFLSILWAGVPGDAWEGANRTLLYLLVFGLFACWPQRGSSAALLVCTWTIALIIVAAYAALHLATRQPEQLQALLPGGRLIYPSGYANANAAQWLMAFWPAVLLARSRQIPWPVRGLLAGGAVLLAEIALLSQSRGSLYATPVTLVLVFALVPGRTRTFATLVPISLGLAAAAPAVLRVGDHLNADVVVASTLHAALWRTAIAAVAVGIVVAIAALAESRRRLSAQSSQRVHRATAAFALATFLAVVLGGLLATGNPLPRIRHGWHTFKAGYSADAQTGTRLTSGLGSNRYDFYRVAIDEFVKHPIGGIGADNFQEQYLVHGRSEETPRYPHSVELRTLAQTGILGTLCALTGLMAALLAVWRAIRSRDPLVSTVAAAALAGFGYWAIHGSFDWFWEFAGLGAPAFALLGIGCALTPHEHTAQVSLAAKRWVAALALISLAGVAAVSLALPWLSQLEVESAARVWTSAPLTAYSRLADAARLNPLGDEAYLVEGSIALRLDELSRGRRDFSMALGRTPDDGYATVELAAIASVRGEHSAARRLIERAVRLEPRNQLLGEAQKIIDAGRALDIAELNRAILNDGRQL